MDARQQKLSLNRSSRNIKKAINCDIHFEGDVAPDTYGKLLMEIFKYLIFNRGQIPLQYDLLVKHLKLGPKFAKNFCHQPNKEKWSSEEPKQICSKRNHCIHMKIEKALQSISDIIGRIDNLFLKFQETEIKELLVIHGGTLVTPKNVFNFILPQNQPLCEGSRIPFNRCLVQLFRNLVTHEEMNNLPEISLTNTFLLVKMRRRGGDNWFLPKPDFVPLTRGTWVTFSFNHGAGPLFTIHKDDRDITPGKHHLPRGTIAKMDCCPGENSSGEFIARMGDLSVGEISPMAIDTSGNEFIWFQAPVHVKGFLEIDQCDLWR